MSNNPNFHLVDLIERGTKARSAIGETTPLFPKTQDHGLPFLRAGRQ